MTMSLSKIFYKVENHLLKQNERSVTSVTSGEYCRYRSEEGLSCAVGCLMTDDIYDYSLEGGSARDFDVVEALAPIIGVSPTIHRAKKIDLLHRLQAIHDGDRVDTWADKLSEVKLDFNIS